MEYQEFSHEIQEKIRNCSKSGKIRNNQENQEVLDRLVLVGPGSAFVIFSFQSIYIGYTSYIVGLLVVYEQITNAWSGEKEK